MSAQKQTAFRLLDLPAELRLKIYEYTVTQNDSIKITLPDCPCKPKDKQLAHDIWCAPLSVTQRTPPALTRTCKSIREDALKFYYKGNDFEAGYCLNKGQHDVLLEWLACIGAEARADMRTLMIYDYFSRSESRRYPDDPCIVSFRQKLGAAGFRCGIEKVEGEYCIYALSFPKVELAA